MDRGAPSFMSASGQRGGSREREKQASEQVECISPMCVSLNRLLLRSISSMKELLHSLLFPWTEKSTWVFSKHSSSQWLTWEGQ